MTDLNATPDDTRLRGLYAVAAVGAMLGAAVMIAEIILTFMPQPISVDPGAERVTDWYQLFALSWFWGLRNLGFLNVVATVVSIPTFAALFVIHKSDTPALAWSAFAIYFVGIAVYLSTFVGFSLLALSREYAAAASADHAALVAAGEAMLARGANHSYGTLPGFLVTEAGAILMACAMLRGRVFGALTSILGIVGFSLLALYEVYTVIVLGALGVGMALAGAGGVSVIAWHLFLGRGLFRLRRHP